MSDTNTKISEAELQIMQLLWDDSPLDAAEVANRVPAERSWSLATVKTLLSRLVAKGAVKTEPVGRKFLYEPLLAREKVAGRQANRLVERLFGGRVSPLVAQLVEQREIDPEDLAELEQLIRDLRK
ncbi:BlaI/MecI/CopY family transcriptional regulator [Sphingomonas sinipercae]|uniref:BlaI/MecI/CopY family transcriptional regulator n=1 Tax=Sphingomonas sinipercae TaxID=2714944 RepID=A0A6G7ZN62_9SPHN|nr:BlaI/MecI/CopY family transcriptional regulator [Sphingomonas sinipercae]QIL02362.1 BlaI/MecI/CopY family transcriptional regulator [Sphingomonas sinipercae]